MEFFGPDFSQPQLWMNEPAGVGWGGVVCVCVYTFKINLFSKGNQKKGEVDNRHKQVVDIRGKKEKFQNQKEVRGAESTEMDKRVFDRLTNRLSTAGKESVNLRLGQPEM